MRIKTILGALAAFAMTTGSVAASAAPAANPASALSLSPNVRAGAPAGHKSSHFGGGVGIGLVILAGIVAITALAVSHDDDRPASR